MTDTLWDASALDLSAYLGRIGMDGHAPSLVALDALLVAHARTFPFDNIDVLLAPHPGVGLDAVQEKFVGRGRGGYCFEHATLVGAALSRLGYGVRRVLARVGDPRRAGRTHLELIVTLPDGTTWLADPGIGRPPLGAIPLWDRAVSDHHGWMHRLCRVTDPEAGWRLERDQQGQWEVMHTSDEAVVRPVDVALGHHYTSTHPDSHFVSTLTVARHRKDGSHATLFVEPGQATVTIRQPGTPSNWREVSTPEAVATLTELATGLSDSEIAGIGEIIDEILSESRTHS